MSDTIWCCPVCGLPLQQDGKSLKCEKRHSFDRGRSGYVHLLPSSRQNAKLPGDNPEMVRARRNFLGRGYYAHLMETLCTAVTEHLPAQGVLLDAGCGEGYYTKAVREALAQSGHTAAVYGADISKTAADLAARADKGTDYAVASVFHLPVRTGSCDLVMSIFAPYCGEEFQRVLRPDGCLVMVIPAAKHLWELKAAVYAHPYENAVKDYALEGFRFIEKRTAERSITLSDPQEIADLFSMTPYAYRTGAAERERLAALQSLTTQTAFEILIYRKQ